MLKKTRFFFLNKKLKDWKKFEKNENQGVAQTEYYIKQIFKTNEKPSFLFFMIIIIF
jgi:protoporphyrinogen oxidase